MQDDAGSPVFVVSSEYADALGLPADRYELGVLVAVDATNANGPAKFRKLRDGDSGKLIANKLVTIKAAPVAPLGVARKPRRIMPYLYANGKAGAGRMARKIGNVLFWRRSRATEDGRNHQQKSGAKGRLIEMSNGISKKPPYSEPNEHTRKWESSSFTYSHLIIDLL